MKKLLLLITMTVACLSTAQAAISVGPSGSGVIDFTGRPAATEWSTRSIVFTPNGDAAYGSAADLINAVQTNATAASITTQTVDGMATTPAAANASAVWSSGGTAVLWTRPTGNGATLLMATLTNETGSAATTLQIIYTLAQGGTALAEQVPEHQVFYSLSGALGSWVNIGALSGGGVGLKSNTVSLASSWPANTTMYVLWADDNATGGTDRGYSLDDVSFTAGVGPVPLTVTLTAPANGLFLFAPTNVTVSANTAGTVPATSVSFFTNGVLAATDPSTPFSTVLSSLTKGTYAIYAQAVNGSETAFSTTNTIVVRDEFISYTGGTVSENFDSMTPSGTFTPQGWYVGAALPATTVTVTVGDGSAAAATAVLGWNYGTTSDSDRALGTAPTGADRNMVARLRNDTASNIDSFEIRYDGEVWRNYTNATDGWLTNFVSFDVGGNWTATGFDFDTPAALRVEPVSAINGNDPANRVASIGGVVTPPVPIPPGGVIYIRWMDFNGSGVTDGGLAIDNFTFTATLGTFQSFVLITSPTNGQSFAEAAPITINATAAMANPVTNVAFFRDGGIFIGNDATFPYSAIYSNSTAGVHTLTAIARDTLGNSVNTTNIITINVSPNVPPSVMVTNPAPGSVYLVGTMVTNVSASASDTDGTIARVEFYLDSVLFATDTSSPYGFDLCDITAINHTIAAVAVDNAGGRATNSISISATNPPGITVIITNGSDWKYLDNGTDQGTAWHALAFDDSSWSNGVAELGYGDAPGRPERTTVSFGPSSTAKFITTYFRKKFVVADPNAFPGLLLNVLRDDGAVVYINNVEVFRSNMTNGTITYLTLAGPAGAGGAIADDGIVYTNTPLLSSVLSTGTNIVAVEIHQEGIDSSDISFDLMLWGVASAGPRLNVRYISSTQVEVSWPIDLSGALLYFKNTLNDPNWTQETSGIDLPSGGFHHLTITSTTPTTKFWTLRTLP